MKLASLMVSDCMTPTPISVEPDETRMRALEIIRLPGVRRLPDSDLTRALVDRLREPKGAAG